MIHQIVGNYGMDQSLDRVLIEVFANSEDIPHLHIACLTNPGDMFIKLQEVLIPNYAQINNLSCWCHITSTHFNIKPRRIKKSLINEERRVPSLQFLQC